MRTLLPITLVLALFVSVGLAAEPVPRTVYWNGERIGELKSAAHEDGSPHAVVFSQLRRDAQQALRRGPYRVTTKTVVPPSGDKRDYLSYGPYWWPNPDTPDGLPYIRRDGHVNPETRTGDRVMLGGMTQDVQTLALAAYFFDDERCADHAVGLLRAWFLDAETGMNPHMQYGQAVPGIVAGRGIGIIDTCGLAVMLDGVELLRRGNHLKQPEMEGLIAWFRDYLSWLRTSSHGRAERGQPNNHGSWYDAQCARYAIFVGDEALAREIVATASRARIDPQIEPDGRQPHELKRTKSFSYSLYNLAALVALARAGDAVGVDLWGYESRDGRSLRAGVDFVLPYLDGTKSADEWPYDELGDIQVNERSAALLRWAADRYDDDRYARPLEGYSENSRLSLLTP